MNSDTNKANSNLRRFHGEASTSAIENASTSYHSPSLIAVGADTHGVALLTALVNLVLSLLCIKAPSILEKIGPTKKGIIILSCLSTYTWVPLILMFLLPLPTKLAPLWLAVMWLVSLAPAVLLNILRDSWLANLIPSHHMGRYLGKRLAITSISHLSTFLVMGYVLDNAHGQLSVSFATLFTVSLIAAFLSFIIYTKMHDLPIIGEKSKTNLGFSTFVSELKDKKLSKFMLFVSLFNLTVNLCGPLYAVYMLNNLNFSYSTFAIVLAAEYLARITSVHFWGRFADRVGNIRVLGIVTRLIPFVPILWLFSPNVVYLVFVQMLSGVCWAAFDLSNQGYIYQVAPQSKKLLYVVYNRSIGLMCMALGGLLGVYLLKGIPPLGGSQIFSIFLLSGIFRLVVVVLIAHRLIDFALPVSQSRINQKVNIDSAFSKMALKRGLFYRPAEWKEFIRVAPLPKNKAANINGKITISKQGLYYQPEEWGKFAKAFSSPQPKTATVKAKVALSKLRLFYRPEEWSKFATMVSPFETKTAIVNAEVTTSKHGLYTRRPQGEWAGFKLHP